MVDLKSETPARNRLLDRIKSRDWFELNIKEIQEKYAERWVGIVGERLVAYGDDPEEVKAKIKGEVGAVDVMLVKVPTGEISRPV